MKEIIASIVLFAVAAVLFALGIRSFFEKGLLLNNAYLYASKEKRERMNKKPYYRQTAVVFCGIGAVFAIDGAALLTGVEWLYGLAAVMLFAVIIYSAVSSGKINKNR